MTCHQFMQKEYPEPDVGDPPAELGCVATNDPKFGMPRDFEISDMYDAVLVVVWRGNEVFNGKGGRARQIGAGV